MAIVFPSRNKPLGELNTTPLIDVMLVILVVLILAVPAGTHSLDYDLPADGPPIEINELRNRITIGADDSVRWNGTPLGDAELAVVLRQATRMKPEPQVEFAPDAAASYQGTARVLRVVKISGVTNFGFVGNERHRDFARAP